MVRLEHLTKEFEGGSQAFRAVDGLNLHVREGEFAVLIGPSGCGKTTTLKMINHIIEPTQGQVYINGRSTENMNKVLLRRGIGYVIQDIGLFPHMTIEENVGIVPRLQKQTAKHRHRKVGELLEMVGLDPSIYRERYPSELSGGQQQRIGVLRALAGEPDIILMDEPFGALDPISRVQLQDELKELQRKLKKTIIFVTHDMDEALKLADKIIIMDNGKPVQIGSPHEILENPANKFVRDFIGEDRLGPKPETTPVSEIMIPNPLTITEDTDLSEAESLLSKSATGLVVTKDDGSAVGLITIDAFKSHRTTQDTEVKELLDENVQTVPLGASVQEAAAHLAHTEHDILLVVDRKMRCVGVLSKAGLVQGIVDVFWQNGNT